jgi:hypothetical protein
MLRPTLAAARGLRLDALGTLFAASLIVATLMVSVPGTGALFTADYPAVMTVSAGQIFPDERVSPAFKVSDHSSGSATDVSSPVAYAGDGRTTTTSAWPTSFATDHYVELSFNSPLPGNVALSAASFDLSWASASGTACVYFDARDSTGALLNSEGSAGAPLSCTSSASPVGLVTPLPGVGTTDDANGATVRMFVSSSAAAATILDQAVLRVTYGSQQYTLYPIDVVDAADGSPSVDHWGLAGP